MGAKNFRRYLMFAALLADLLVFVFVFVAVGIEHISIRPGITRVNALNLYDFAWSHSLVMDVVWVRSSPLLIS